MYVSRLLPGGIDLLTEKERRGVEGGGWEECGLGMGRKKERKNGLRWIDH